MPESEIRCHFDVVPPRWLLQAPPGHWGEASLRDPGYTRDGLPADAGEYAYADPANHSVQYSAYWSYVNALDRGVDSERALAGAAYACSLATGNAAAWAISHYDNTPSWQRRDVSEYWEDGDDIVVIRPALLCGCNDPHCDECHPDGPPDWCECEDCVPAEVDDLDDADDWPGLPDMPISPDGRCRFGVEVEYDRREGRTNDRRTIAHAITEAGIACIPTDYTHSIAKYWKMTSDATVSGGECVSPILPGDDRSIDEVKEVIRIIKASGGVTSRNVGLHVHLDVTEFTNSQLKALAHNLRVGQDALAAYVPDHRYDGSNGCGASLLRSAQWDAIEEWIEDVNPREFRRSRDNRIASCPVQRYVAFNFNSLLTYGTVEARLLGHTLNTLKVATWIRALQTVVAASRRRAMLSGDLLEWLAQYGLEAEHVDRYRKITQQRGTADRLLVAAS